MGLPTISTEITINGNGFKIFRDGASPQFRLVTVLDGTLTLNDVDLESGAAVNGLISSGGNLFNFAGNITVNNSELIRRARCPLMSG
jgi:hypothetical protein